MLRSEKEFDYIKIKLASPLRILQWSQRKLPNGQFIGEVQKSETINYRTFKPEMDGLFCERIFGPSKSLECACGKYKRVRYEGLICERCGVELTESRIRRHRMGHINLIYPVAHVWYINSRPNYMALLLEVEQCENRFDPFIIEFIPEFLIFLSPLGHILFEQDLLILIQPKDEKKSNYINLWDGRIKRIKLSSLVYFMAEDEISFYGIHWDLQQYRRNRKIGLTGYPLKPYPKPKPQYRRRQTPKYLLQATPSYLIGTVLIKRELARLNLNTEIFKTRSLITVCTSILSKESSIYSSHFTRREKPKKKPNKDEPYYHWAKKWEIKRIYKLRDLAIKRIRILENLIATGSNPAWMILIILPVIPPALRPMIQLEGGRFATSDLNELYRRIITRNNRLLRLLEIDAPQLIIRNEKRMLQEAVDTLVDNGKRGKIALSANNRPLKSLSDIIKGKHGRFRQNLLGKRVDYSGRSVIVVGPSLKLNQCGLPYEMAIELFQPFIIRELINDGLATNMKVAKNLIQQNEPIIDPVLKKVLMNHPIFLNRAPTLHRLGIQAFEPILVQGRAIQLHPLVCSAFNADFDGDQMAVHIPLSLQAQAECYMLMLSPYNFLSPANGEPIITPSQDMVLGCYYLTVQNIKGLLGSNHYFASLEDVILAYHQEKIEVHSCIWVRYRQELDKPSNLIRKTKLKDNTYIEYYQNKQIRKDRDGNTIVQYLQTTTGRVLFNYTIQKALNILEQTSYRT